LLEIISDLRHLRFILFQLVSEADFFSYLSHHSDILSTNFWHPLKQTFVVLEQ